MSSRIARVLVTAAVSALMLGATVAPASAAALRIDEAALKKAPPSGCGVDQTCIDDPDAGCGYIKSCP